MSGALPQVVVVGTGSIGRRHLANLLALGASPLVCSEHHRRPAVEVAGATLPALAGYDAALASDAPVVLLANPSALHAGHALAAVEAGKHVLVEKPVALSAAEAAPLVAAVTSRPGQVVGVVQQFRFHPLLDHLRAAVAGEWVGDVVAVEARQGEHVADYHPDEDYRQGYAARAELGGGVLLTQNHLLDLCVHLLGAPGSVRSLVRQPGVLDLEVEDAASFLADVGPVDLYGRVDFLARPRRFSVEVVGTEGRARWDYYSATFEAVGRSGERAVSITTGFDRDAMFRAVLTDFLGAVDEGRPPACRLTDAVAVLEVADAIRRSARSGRAEAVQA